MLAAGRPIEGGTVRRRLRKDRERGRTIAQPVEALISRECPDPIRLLATGDPTGQVRRMRRRRITGRRRERSGQEAGGQEKP